MVYERRSEELGSLPDKAPDTLSNKDKSRLVHRLVFIDKPVLVSRISLCPMYAGATGDGSMDVNMRFFVTIHNHASSLLLYEQLCCRVVKYRVIFSSGDISCLFLNIFFGSAG